MDEQQVDVVGLQLAQALVDACRSLLLTCIGNPHFRHQEDVLPGNPALADCISYPFFVEICLRRVNHPVPGLKGIGHDTFRFIHGNLEDAETDGRHHHSVVQSYLSHTVVLF